MAKNQGNQEVKKNYKETMDALTKEAVALPGFAFEDLRFLKSKKNAISLKIDELKDEKTKNRLKAKLEEFVMDAAEVFVAARRPKRS